MIQEACWTHPGHYVCRKISLPTIKTTNVEVHAVLESQDALSISPYYMPFAMLAMYPMATQKAWLIHVYINYAYNACVGKY